ncbi:MAG: helix-turn-helix domain-containing protein [Chloroflexota bacterium]|nr:helix-turn-helix domain-containing protein [Chloroflexota bacterium]
MVTDTAVDTLRETVEELRRRGEAQRAEALETVLVENGRLRESLALIRELSDSRAELGQTRGAAPSYIPSVAARRAASRTQQPVDLDLLTSTEVGDLVGVTGQTIKNWVKEGRMKAYRIGSRIMVPREVVEAYVRSAGESLDLDDCSPEEAVRLVNEARGKS